MDEVSGGLKSVGAAIELINAFAEDEELGVTEVAKRLGVAKSTAHRLLTTLAAGGIVEQVHGYGSYRLGVRLIELGQLVSSRQDLRRMAAGVMEELRESTGWTVHLTVAQGADSLSLERLTTRRGALVSEELPRRWPLHFTSAGKVLCAFDPAARAARLRAGLPARTRSTITSPERFERELETIRRVGYGRARDELMLNLSSLAAPVTDAFGVARAAVSILGYTPEFDASETRLAAIVIAAGKRLSRNYHVMSARDS